MPRRKKEESEPMPLAEGSLAEAAAVVDWDHESQITMLCRFIDEKGLGVDFKEFISEQAEAESEAPDEDEDEDEFDDEEEEDEEDDGEPEP